MDAAATYTAPYTAVRPFGQESLAHITSGQVKTILDEGMREAADAAPTRYTAQQWESMAEDTKATLVDWEAVNWIAIETAALLYSVPENQSWTMPNDAGILQTRTTRGWIFRAYDEMIRQFGQNIIRVLDAMLPTDNAEYAKLVRDMHRCQAPNLTLDVFTQVFTGRLPHVRANYDLSEIVFEVMQAVPRPMPEAIPVAASPAVNIFGQETMAHVTRERVEAIIDESLSYMATIEAGATMVVLKVATLLYTDPAHPENLTCYMQDQETDYAYIRTECGWEVCPLCMLITPVGRKVTELIVENAGNYPLLVEELQRVGAFYMADCMLKALLCRNNVIRQLTSGEP